MMQWVEIDYDNPDTLPHKEGDYFCEVSIGSIKTSIIKRSVKFERGRFMGLGDTWSYVKRWIKETEEPSFSLEDMRRVHQFGVDEACDIVPSEAPHSFKDYMKLEYNIAL